MFEIVSGQPDDWQEVREALDTEGLPVRDLGSDQLREFLVARDARGIFAGVIGLQRFGKTGLLRSLVVARWARGSGLGHKLVSHLEQHAFRYGCTELWLLTIDADQFFLRLGFEQTSRQGTPDPIRGSAEFSELCPADAHLMRKSLASQ